MDNPLVLYSNTEEVRSYAEAAEVPQEPLPDEETTKPEPVLTTAPDAAPAAPISSPRPSRRRCRRKLKFE